MKIYKNWDHFFKKLKNKKFKKIIKNFKKFIKN